MMEFEKQSEIMEMKEEMMNDAIDDAMGDEDDEEERYRVFYECQNDEIFWKKFDSGQEYVLSFQL